MPNHDVPNGWKLSDFGEVLVAKPQYGLTARSSTKSGKLIYLRISDVTDEGELKTDDLHFIEANYANASKYELHENDFLIARSGSVGRVYLYRDLGKPAVFASYLIRFRLDTSKVLPKFVFYWGLSPRFKREIETRRKIVAQPNINAQDYCRFKVPIPPLETQRGIIQILERAHTLKRDREQANQLTNKIIQSVFLKMFGDPATNSKNWPTIMLGELIEEGPQNGLYKHSSFYGSGTPIVRINNFYEGVLSVSDLKRLKLTEDEIQTYVLQNGDILINRVNSPEFVGKCALVEGLTEDTVFESNMMRFRLKRSLATPEFVVDFLLTAHAKARIVAMSKRAVHQVSINQQDVKSIQLYLPPIELQDKFSIAFHKARGMINRQDESTNEINELFHSLMHKAFSGELRNVS